VREDWSTPLLLEEMQDEFRCVNRRASSHGDNRVCIEILQDLYAFLDICNWTMLSDLRKGRSVDLLLLQQALDVRDYVRLDKIRHPPICQHQSLFTFSRRLLPVTIKTFVDPNPSKIEISEFLTDPGP